MPLNELPPAGEGLSPTVVGETIRIEVDASATSQSFLSVLLWLRTNDELHFYDQFYPSVSDPGAYVSIRRHACGFVYRMGNHGWSSDWHQQSPELLAAWLFLNKSRRHEFSEPLTMFTIDTASSSTT